MVSARILVVEDEALVARDVRQMLVRLGYEVPALAATADDAIASASALKPDLVLMDINLRGDGDGIQAAETIRRRHGLPVVFLTAYSDEVTTGRAQITEPFGYVLKPFEERELAMVIQIALYRHNAEKRLRQMERWLATTLRSIGDAVIATDTGGTITFVNRVAEVITGWSQHEAVGRPLGAVLHLVNAATREPVDDLVARVLRENVVIELDPNTQLIARDGSEVPVDDSAAPIRDDRGQVSGVVIVFRDITARKWAEDRLQHTATHDALTGLPNRALLLDRLRQAFERSRRHPPQSFAVLYMDLDRFKVINDSLGHRAGDQVLTTTASRLAEGLRAEDTVARLGGDEFVLLLSNVGDPRYAVQVAERIGAAVAAPIRLDDREVYTAASIGIAISRSDYAQPDDMLRDADAALYRAKALGRGRSVMFDAAMHAGAMELMQLETDLRRAVGRDEFRLLLQPIVRLADHAVCGFEALLRWQHPERGLLAPAAFLDVAEEIGILASLRSWALHEACAQIKRLSTYAPLRRPFVCVNLSNQQFWEPQLVETVDEALQAHRVEPTSLCLELTETVVAEPETALPTVQRLRRLGVRLSMDDFGTGYSSLSMLHQLPMDTLKIDRAFVKQLGAAAPDDDTLVRTILLLARTLKLDVVAEGIETEAQYAYLRAMGCTYGQGYHIAHPLPEAEAVAMLLSSPA